MAYIEDGHENGVVTLALRSGTTRKRSQRGDAWEGPAAVEHRDRA